MKFLLSVLSMLCLTVLSCGSNSQKLQPDSTADRAVQLSEKPEPLPDLTTITEPPSNCPEGMIEINGSYCPVDDAKCLYWVDNYGKRSKIDTDRCGEWSKPVHCTSTIIHKHFCIAKYEAQNKKGEIPQDWMSYNQSKAEAEKLGNRLCTHSEWSMAALGPNLHPYPFGDGFHRDHSCNIDRHITEVGLTGAQVMKVSDPKSEVAEKLRSQLVPSGSLPNCKSDYGVFDMSGNIDEWVVNETGKPYVSGLSSGHAWGVRNASRPMTTAHSPSFYWYESSYRQCRDIKPILSK